jgi:hypothetical protein
MGDCGHCRWAMLYDMKNDKVIQGTSKKDCSRTQIMISDGKCKVFEATSEYVEEQKILSKSNEYKYNQKRSWLLGMSSFKVS